MLGQGKDIRIEGANNGYIVTHGTNRWVVTDLYGLLSKVSECTGNKFESSLDQILSIKSEEFNKVFKKVFISGRITGGGGTVLGEERTQ